MYWTCLSHTGTHTEFMSRFKHSHCFPSVRTTIDPTNSHPGLFMLPDLPINLLPTPNSLSFSALSTELKYPPMQTASKEPMKQKLGDCAKTIHPLSFFFFFFFFLTRVSTLTWYPQYLVFDLLLQLETMILANLHVFPSQTQKNIFIDIDNLT